MANSQTDEMKQYEEHVRSNESLRDNMDGKMSEPRMEKSMENNKTCNCSSQCTNCKCEQSMG